MFGLGKKKINPTDFGLALLQFSSDFLISDGSRALGCAFSDFDGSGGSDKFLLARGISKDAQSLFFRLFAHAAIQAAATPFHRPDRLEIVRGAMRAFKPVPHYNVESFIELYEQAMLRKLDLSPEVAALQAPAISWVVVEIAKSILQVYPARPEVQTGLMENFPGFAGALGSAVATVQRASDQIRTRFEPTF